MTAKATGIAKGQLVRIFISHKDGDREAAKDIHDLLKRYGKGKLDVFVSEELPKGEGWREALLEQLRLADRLVLLYTDPHQNWDWCLYESGFFHGRHDQDKSKRLVVVHDSEISPPKPLQYIQSVKVSPDKRADLEQCIREVFGPPAPGLKPINAKLLTDQFAAERKKIEDAIIKAVCNPPKEKMFATEIRIEVETDQLRTAKEGTIPNGARVFGDAKSLSLFSIDESPDGLPWTSFYHGMDGVSDNTADWAASLADIMRSLAFAPWKLTSTGLPLYRYRQGGRTAVYRPGITSFGQCRGKLWFKVLFMDLPTETTVEPEGPITFLAQALQLCRMFRNGVISDLKDQIDHVREKRKSGDYSEPKARGELAEATRRFRGIGANVYVESRNGGYDRERMRNCFEGADLAQIDKAFKDWDLLYQGKAKELSNDDTVELEEAAQLVEDALRINKQFMELCAKRYYEIVKTL
jgi:hypothetical protein